MKAFETYAFAAKTNSDRIVSSGGLEVDLLLDGLIALVHLQCQNKS